jgi:hypothetical protein
MPKCAGVFWTLKTCQLRHRVLEGIYGTQLAVPSVIARAKFAYYTCRAKTVHRALKASTTDAVALVVCPLQVGVTGVEHQANMPISSVLSNVTQLAWHVSGYKKVSSWAVAAQTVGKLWLNLVLRAVATAFCCIFMAAEAHAGLDTAQAQERRANKILVLATKRWTGNAVTAICCPSHRCSIVVQ